VKRQLYAKYGVAEYWVIDPENRSVDIYRLVGQTLERIATLMDDDVIMSPILPDFQLRIAAIFIP
jgi:Uma2 family endonuclease